MNKDIDWKNKDIDWNNKDVAKLISIYNELICEICLSYEEKIYRMSNERNNHIISNIGKVLVVFIKSILYKFGLYEKVKKFILYI